jgi:hypothetical protein
MLGSFSSKRITAKIENLQIAEQILGVDAHRYAAFVGQFPTVNFNFSKMTSRIKDLRELQTAQTIAMEFHSVKHMIFYIPSN